MSKQRIIFIMHKLDIGGAERIIVNLVNHLDREEFDIHLLLLKAKGVFLDQVNADVTIHDLQSDSAKRGFFRLLRTLHRLKPDRIFSGIGYLNALLSLFIPFMNRLSSRPIRWIARETNVVSIINQKEKFTAILDWLYRHTYRNFDQIVCQSAYMQQDLVTHYRLPIEQTVIIPNPVDIERVRHLSEEPLDYTFPPGKVHLLAVGALRRQKRFDRLLETMAVLDDRYHLTIVGGGVEEQALHQLAHDLGIRDRVNFVGHQINPYNFMKAADVILLSSDYEGFPNVLLEANCCGLPIIALGCPGGTAEIIREGVNGYLVACNDLDPLIERIIGFDSDAFDANVIQAYVEEHYNLNAIVHRYEEVLR